jgi:hypothetical protein
MIRKLNFTGRRKIRRSRVRVDIMRDTGARRYFNIQLDLSGLDLAANARIYVEAYHRTGTMRFDFGTIASLHVPADRLLKGFSDACVPLFRVKAVDRTSEHGRILAAVDKIRPESIENEPAGSHALLHVEYDELGSRVWELDLDGDWPVLKLNQRVDEAGLVAATDQRFFALVYPEVFRQVLKRVVLEDEHTDPDCDDDWPSLWLRLARTLPGVGEPPFSRTRQAEWIAAAVEAFSTQFDVLSKFNQAQQGL